jgi:hypothetical protein
VGPVGFLLLKMIKPCAPVLERYALQKLLDDGSGRPPSDTYQILALDLARRMHEAMSQLAVRGEQQQAGSVDVQAADGDPSPKARRRQSLENSGTALGVTTRRHLTNGFVIEEQLARHRRPRGIEVELAAIEADLVLRTRAIAKLRGPSRDRDASAPDPLFYASARAQPGGCQQFLQSGHAKVPRLWPCDPRNISITIRHLARPERYLHEAAAQA